MPNLPALQQELAQAVLLDRFAAVRAATARLVQNLTPEDQMVQSCAEASPIKWHLAHTTWFFETFVLREFEPDFAPFDKDFSWLFNSYYKSLGPHPEKRLRASFSRPALERVLQYRQATEDRIARLLANGAPAEALERIELGLHHEQQHQELILTDIKHAFWTSPLQPAYAASQSEPTLDTRAGFSSTLQWHAYAAAMVEIGHRGNGFAFDNELPAHRVYLQSFQLASRAVTCAEYLAFMLDGGYRRPELWLSDGWDTSQAERWEAPLYWQRASDEEGGNWSVYTLRGCVPLEALQQTPVCHISYYEADAFARWAGFRLPTEFEWEHAATRQPVRGNLLEAGSWHPQAAIPQNPQPANGPLQLFGDVWEWTQSPYVAYPRYRPAAGALGEYNGKFMCNQLVLRGGSVATSGSDLRATYRNFFAPATRWQFSGIRLASDGEPA